MNTKKFPTPNLDAVINRWFEMDSVSTYNERVSKAVQADIALAVEKAAKVPEGVNFQITWNLQTGWSMYAIHPRQELIDCAIKYLESLTVAPMEATDLVPMQFIETRTKTGENTFAVDSIEPVVPVEKRCWTCAWFVLRTDWSENYGQCNRSVIPSTTTKRCGDMCLCWKAKP